MKKSQTNGENLLRRYYFSSVFVYIIIAAENRDRMVARIRLLFVSVWFECSEKEKKSHRRYYDRDI